MQSWKEEIQKFEEYKVNGYDKSVLRMEASYIYDLLREMEKTITGKSNKSLDDIKKDFDTHINYYYSLIDDLTR